MMVNETGQSSIFRWHQYWLPARLLVLFLFVPVSAPADQLQVFPHGLTEPLLSPVDNRLEAFRIDGDSRLTRRRLRKITQDAEREVALSLRPYGYYHPEISSTLTNEGNKNWKLDLHINPGPPVIVVSADIEITGDGAQLPELRDWHKNWPLNVGVVLNQATWESHKQLALEVAEADGYLGASFTQHLIEADLENNEARLKLDLETGPQAVMGTVTFNQDQVKPGILELLPRFKQGQAYDSWLLEKFRLDLWRTGYFNNVSVVEERRMEENPPVVNLLVNADARTRNTYQGSLGLGSDTGVRAQILWSRHLISARGDTLDMGLGWQQTNDEYSFRTNYRLPRRVIAREFWTGNLFIRKENQDLKVRIDDDSSDFIKLTNGNVIDYSFKLGRLKVRDLRGGYQQLFETLYGQYVLSKSDISLSDFSQLRHSDLLESSELDEFKNTGKSLSLGVNWDLPVVHGNSFETVGHHERAWIFTSNTAWGSDSDFTQAYFSTNWHKMLGKSWKVLLRGEVGYSNSDINDLTLTVEDQDIQLSVTNLPNLYRFKAGGSRSVRGYDFEVLSNNGIGSNNIITASAEIEWNFRQNWSVAAFFDAGNAFNEWGDVELKKGLGVGVRWYSIAGPIRVDIAQALDLDGNPWRLHFTIGTPLL
jgi:translocation and assembly module TamA